MITWTGFFRGTHVSAKQGGRFVSKPTPVIAQWLSMRAFKEFSTPVLCTSPFNRMRDVFGYGIVAGSLVFLWSQASGRIGGNNHVEPLFCVENWGCAFFFPRTSFPISVILSLAICTGIWPPVGAPLVFVPPKIVLFFG